jgi:hypothetical protein
MELEEKDHRCGFVSGDVVALGRNRKAISWGR